MKTVLTVFSMLTLTACVSTAPRIASSSLGCMQAVLDEKVPSALPDKRTHCLAAGLIARYCSVGEAYLAGIATELVDLLGPGDAEWADWHADRTGITCARNAPDDGTISACCARFGY